MNDKFYFIEKADFENKEHKHYYTIRIFVQELCKSVLIFVDEKVYVNYASSKFNDTISSNKVTKISNVNKYGQIVTSYKLIN